VQFRRLVDISYISVTGWKASSAGGGGGAGAGLEDTTRRDGTPWESLRLVVSDPECNNTETQYQIQDTHREAGTWGPLGPEKSGGVIIKLKITIITFKINGNFRIFRIFRISIFSVIHQMVMSKGGVAHTLPP
jgi:hypothetical protein